MAAKHKDKARISLSWHCENPATQQTLAEVASGQAEDIDRAVAAAERGFKEWSNLAPAERGKLLAKVANKLLERRAEFARAESLDAGKAYPANLNIDVPFCADFWRYYAGAADKLRSPVVANEAGVHRYAVRELYGVIGSIARWDFPLVMATLKMCAALACGNTIVMKMAEQTPATVTMLAQLIHEVGVPKGVVNVVHGLGDTAGQALANHPNVKKIAFTGSSKIGRLLGQGERRVDIIHGKCQFLRHLSCVGFCFRHCDLPIAIRVNQQADALRDLHTGNQAQFDAYAVGRERDLRHLQILIQHVRCYGEMNGAHANQINQEPFHFLTRRAP